jgi:hypothetical protein
MNKKAGEILERNPEEMIGKHVWTEFPESVDQALLKPLKAVKTQAYIYLENSIVLMKWVKIIFILRSMVYQFF